VWTLSVTGSFAFSVRGIGLDFDAITTSLGISPTKTVGKGEMVSKALNKEAPCDSWIYELRMQEGHENFEELVLLLKELLPNAAYVRELQKTCGEVEISCYLRSDFAQIGFELSTEVIDRFHILSFGAVQEQIE
jgi:predicted ArsR family transcriptional regulator